MGLIRLLVSFVEEMVLWLCGYCYGLFVDILPNLVYVFLPIKVRVDEL
jgi:hypothetical protein